MVIKDSSRRPSAPTPVNTGKPSDPATRGAAGWMDLGERSS